MSGLGELQNQLERKWKIEGQLGLYQAYLRIWGSSWGSGLGLMIPGLGFRVQAVLGFTGSRLWFMVSGLGV